MNMSQNIYDDPRFPADPPEVDEKKERPMIFLLRVRKPG